jgi:hypothetical protein
MALLRRTRDEAQDRPARPTAGRHRGTRKVRLERVPAGGRHVRMLGPTPASGAR